mgnify:CR=1 FL=1
MEVALFFYKKTINSYRNFENFCNSYEEETSQQKDVKKQNWMPESRE